LAVVALVVAIVCLRQPEHGAPSKPVWDITPPSSDRVLLSIPSVSVDTVRDDVFTFVQMSGNGPQDRRGYCESLLRKAGCDPRVTQDGDVWVWKQGSGSEVVILGAHHDKASGPGVGILDNMLGCILVARLADAFHHMDTRASYLIVLYNDEERGRRIGSANHPPGAPKYGRPAYIIEIDYVGDKRAPLGGRWLGPMQEYTVAGLKLSSYPMPKPPTIHTERDSMSNVDVAKAYLAYETALFLIEGIERGDGLVPPDTVAFWKKDSPYRPLPHRRATDSPESRP